MNIPTSLIVVLLVAAWIVVLVPMVARRRDRVPQTPDDGTRVLTRAKATLRRKPGAGRRSEATSGDDTDEEALVTVGGRAEHEPADAADEWTTVQAEHARSGSTPALGRRPPTDDDGEMAEADDTEPALFGDSEAAATRGRSSSAPDEFDDDEWEASRAEGRPTAVDDRHVRDEQLRPVPHRAGRGGFDPEAAEATRAYKYRRRRRITLALLVLTVGFAVAAPLTALQPLWIGAAVSFLLLVAYLSYLRRQVRIENAIRERRMERLQRARQIRPENARERRDHGYRGRDVVDPDDGDPSFADLEEPEPIEYRRAV